MKATTIRRAMLAVVWTVATTSAILSYAGIRQVGVTAGFGPVLSWLLPICIDGLVLAGALVVLDAEAKQTGKAFGWVLTLTGVLASIAANVATADGPVGIAAHAAPPAILALTLEAWLHTMRSGVRAQQAEDIVGTEPGAEPASPATAAPPRHPSSPVKAAQKTDTPAVLVTEAEVAALRAEGLSYQLIADTLSLEKGSSVSKATVMRRAKAAEEAAAACG